MDAEKLNRIFYLSTQRVFIHCMNDVSETNIS